MHRFATGVSDRKVIKSFANLPVVLYEFSEMPLTVDVST
jgi:hypothetical protein